MRKLRLLAVAALALSSTVAGTMTASTAPPSNYTFAGRTAVGALPFTTTQNTTEATTDADDAELNATCGAPAMDASVWYEVTATEDGGLVADVSGSDYTAGVFVATGSPGSFDILACAPDAAAWETVAGQTYSVIVIDDQADGTGNGGSMKLNIDKIPPPPDISVTVNPTGVHHKNGDATVSGTITCGSTSEFALMFVDLNQRVGRGSVLGSAESDIICDDTAHPFSVRVSPFNGKFAGGKTAAVTLAFACGAFECREDFQENVIQLRGNA